MEKLRTRRLLLLIAPALTLYAQSARDERGDLSREVCDTSSSGRGFMGGYEVEEGGKRWSPLGEWLEGCTSVDLGK